MGLRVFWLRGYGTRIIDYQKLNNNCGIVTKATMRAFLMAHLKQMMAGFLQYYPTREKSFTIIKF